MKTKLRYPNSEALGLGFLCAMLTASPLGVCLGESTNVDPFGSKPQESAVTSDPGTVLYQTPAVPRVMIEQIEPVSQVSQKPNEETPWLGVATTEASEGLSSQLQLDPGVGLEVTYVTPDSPAAKAGLQKNDLLVRFDGQPLVHPAQFRKLVQVRKVGDTIHLAFYRRGKEQTLPITLAKSSAPLISNGGWGNTEGTLRDMERRLRDLNVDKAIEEQMKALRDSMGNFKVDQKALQEQIRRSVEQARRSYDQAIRAAGAFGSNYGPALKRYKELTDSGVVVDNDASVTVRTTGKAAKSLVKTDDSGTIVIVANPDLRLTAHDKAGKLLFDGEIRTDEQRSKVPAELWQKVEPLLKKMGAAGMKKAEEEKPEAEESE